MKSKINIPVGVALFVALALLALSAVVTLPQLSPSLVFGQEMPLQPPTNLTAVAVGQKNIALVWTPSGMGTGYRVERSEDGHTGWTMVDTSGTSFTATTTTYNDRDMSLELNTVYYYRVSTTGPAPSSRSRPSNVANATTGGVGLPGAPSALALAVEAPSRIKLTWTAPGASNTGGGDITGYKIEYSDSSETAVASVAANTWDDLVANTMSVSTTYSDDGSVANLEAGDQRWYRVSAINSAGAGMASEPMRSEETPAAATVTSAPTGLIAVVMGPTEVKLSWTAPTDTRGDEIDGYRIEYSDLTTGNWPAFGNNPVLTGNNDTTYTDKSLTVEETIRQYRVSAIISPTLTSGPSNVAVVTTAEATVPGKPDAPTLTPTGAQSINLEWDAPTSNGGAEITGYRIERSENRSSWPAEPLEADTDSGTEGVTAPYSDTMIPKANTRWYYRVSAINSKGVGEPSDAAFASTRQVVLPGAPTNLTAWEERPTRIVLEWQAPAITGGEITGYKIEYSDDDTSSFTNDNDTDNLVANTMSVATTYTDDGSEAGLEEGDVRFYRVTAINSGGMSAASNSYSALTGATALMTPTILTANNTGQKNITLSWGAPSSGGATTVYRVERSEDRSTGWAMVGNSEAGETTYVDGDTSLKLSTRYYYRVSTTDNTPRRSSPSNVANATTGGVNPPGAPSGLTLVAQGPSRINLVWSAVAETENGGGAITGYKIEYSDSSEGVAADVPPNTWRVLEANTMSVSATYTDDGSVANLEQGAQRWYRVSAVNSAGAGMPSEPVQSEETPPAALVATSAPTGLMAVAMGPTQIDLSWTAPTDTSGDEITGYKIESTDYDATNGTWDNWDDLVLNTGNDDTTYTDKSLTVEETTRQYRVSAKNAAATDSPPSYVATATTAEATVPGKPNAPMLAPTGAQEIAVTWDDRTSNGGDAITGYRIERSESANTWPAKPLVPDTSKLAEPILVTTTTYPDTTVPKANTRWYYRVSAINSEGVGEPSDAAFAFTSPAGTPAMPDDLTAWEEGPTRIVLLWQAPDDTGGEITGYKIEYAAATENAPDTVDAGTWDELVADTMSDATTYIDDGSVAGLEAGTIRYYRVTTLNSSGQSDEASNEYSAVTGSMAVALTIDGPATASHPENDAGTVATYTASGPGSDMATWSTEGADDGDFSISNDGVLTFAPSPNYEMPADADTNNVYMVTVKATSGTNSATREVTVTVTNADDGGEVTLSSLAPSVDTEISAALADEDTVTENTLTWQWSRSMTMDGTYDDIDMATSLTYTPVDDEGYFVRATARYNDGEGTGKEAMETTTSRVTAADPLLAYYDTNPTNGRIDRSEVITAIRDYFADPVSFPRADVIRVIRLYFSTLDS